jgi:soluble lytic murein transglycosylase-like protein
MKPALRRGFGRSLLPLLLLLASGLSLAQEALDVPEAAQAAPQIPAVASPEPDSLDQTVPWYAHLAGAARAYGVDVHLLQAVVKVESDFNPFAVSRSGAIGLMQIMPATAMGVAGLRGTAQSLSQQLQDPAINVHTGALYLRSLMDTFAQRLDLVLAAYNAGIGNVRKAGNRVPANGETPLYVKKVLAAYASIKSKANGLQPDSPPLPLIPTE